MRFSAPAGLVALVLAALCYYARLWQPAAACVGLAVIACLIALIRLTKANGEVPKPELVALVALLVGLMGSMAGVLLF